ncbi:MAG: hypothetical protein ACRDJ1_01710 [Actinomycetota bacterium]
MNVWEVLLLAAGALLVAATMMSAVRTVVLPRGVPVRLSRRVFLTMRFLFELRIGRKAPYARRDKVMALYAPLSLLTLLVVWLAIVLTGYGLMYYALGVRPMGESFLISGSSLLTLGFARGETVPTTILTFSEATLGLILLTILISYLPSAYGVFSRREAMVESLGVRAGSPPSAAEMLERYWRIEFYDELPEVWERWEAWWIELAETHTSFPALAFFRSPDPMHSWVTAGGTILDAAALYLSAVARPREPRAELMIRAGYLALRRVADFFRIPNEHDPRPDDPISLAREEFDRALERLAFVGVPLKEDRDRAWRDFAGWRVNYDSVLLSLARLTSAPAAPWSSDRSRVYGPLQALRGGTRPAPRERSKRAR